MDEKQNTYSFSRALSKEEWEALPLEAKQQLLIIELLESIRHRLGILVLFLVVIPLLVGGYVLLSI